MSDEWPGRFESLGDNCEWGFVQKHYGVDEGSLLKWCRIKSIEDVIKFLESDFSAFYRFENLVPISEDMVLDTSSRIEYHSELYSEKHVDGWKFRASYPELRARYDSEYEKRVYLLEKFIRDLRGGEKIWIYKENTPIAMGAVNRLAVALQSFNPDNILLYLVRDATPENGGGAGLELSDIAAGVYVRSIQSFAPYWAVTEAVPEHWNDVCMKLISDLKQFGLKKTKPILMRGSGQKPIRHLRPTTLTTKTVGDVDERVRQNIAARAERFPDAWSGPNSWVSRFEIGAFYVAPLMAQMSLKPAPRVLEIGCGQGQKALSYLPFVGSVLGVDIDAEHVNYAKRAADAMGAGNAEFRCIAADDVASILKSEQFDIVVLYAVLEHLIPRERQNLLGTIWEHLRDDGVMLVGETPNRVSAFDSHSTNLPFVDSLTNELYLKYTGKFSTRGDHRDFMAQFEDKVLGSYRAGRGVSFHEFDLLFGRQGGVGAHIQSDSFSALLRNAYPITRAELSFLDLFRWHQFPIDQAFSRYWIEMYLKKGANEATPASRSFTLQSPTRAENQIVGYDQYGVHAYGLPNNRSELTFEFTKPATAFQFSFDVHESAGAVEIADSSGNTIEIFEFDDLRSRVPEFQKYVAIDRLLPAGCEHVRIKPLGMTSRVISSGLGVFGSEPRASLDPRRPTILSAVNL